MWILTNQRECVRKCVLEDVLLAFLVEVLSFTKNKILVLIVSITGTGIDNFEGYIMISDD